MDYVKTGLKRGLIGIPFGVFITFTILILTFSITNTDPTLSISTLTSQYIIGGILGFFYASMSVIFEIEELNMTYQTIIHFVITNLFSLVPCALYAGWIPRNSISISIFIAISIFIYFIIWLSFKIYWDNQIKNLNDELDK